MMRRSPLVVLLALSALLLSTGGSALAQSDEYIAESSGVGYSIEIMGEDGIFGGVSGAEVTSDPFAEAFGVGSSLDEESASEATAESDGEHNTDQGEGSLDQIPLVGDALFVSSEAEAGITDGLPFASAEADGLLLQLSGDLLADVLGEVFVNLEPVTDGLDDGIDQLEDAVLSQVTDALLAACNEALTELGGGFDQIRDGLGAITDQMPDEFQDGFDALTGELREQVLSEEACALLFDVVSNPPRVGEVLDALLDILTGLELLTVSLGGSQSNADAVPGEVVAFADAVGLDISLPSLANLTDALETALNLLVDDFRGEIIDRYGSVLTDLADDLLPEELMEFLAPVLGLDLLDDDTPILRIIAGDTDATASFDRDTGEITTSGTAVPLTIQIAQSIANILGQENEIRLEDGDSVTIFEDTPLESTLAAGAVTQSSVERDGLSGEEVLSEAVALSLIEADGEGPVLVVAAAESYAAVYGSVGDEPEALPVTGGGTVPVALLLLALGVMITRRLRTPVAERDEA